MSTPVAPANPNRKLLIGAGVGCGCLSLIIAIVALILIFSSLGRTQSQPPQSGPQPAQPQPAQPQPAQPQPAQPQPAQPQPAQPQPAPQGEGIEGLKVQMSMVKVQGEGDNARPGAPSDTFAQGETVGAFGVFAEVRGTHEIHVVWIRIEGDKPTLVAKPAVWTISEQQQGKNLFARLGGAVPGNYAFGLLKATGPQQFQPIAIRRFRVQ